MAVRGPVLVTGGEGLLGRAVATAFANAGVTVCACGRDRLDVTSVADVEKVFGQLRPRLVVHCAAMTDVDACELDPDRANKVNAEGSRRIAEAAASIEAGIVAISTDYIFDGRKTDPYTEFDEPSPIQAYGRSKLAGEVAVRDANPRHHVVRSAWIYGDGGKNFLSKLPDLARAGTPLKAVVDQTGSPTFAPDLAEAIVELAATTRYGTYHVVNAGACTFADFCRLALDELDSDVDVTEVSWRDLDRPAPRPERTALRSEAMHRAGLRPLRGWRRAAKVFCAGAR